MIETLKHIDTEYVLITLDDHFLISPVDSTKFEGAFDIIKKHKRISALSFIAYVPADEKTKWHGNFGLWKMNKYFRVNLDTAIWRKKADTVWLRSVLCVFGLLACYLLGTVWFIYVYHATDSWAKALTMCVVPYLIPDALKITLAVSLAVAVRKALPASAFFAEKAKNKE